MKQAVAALAVLGSLIGGGSAVQALVVVGRDPAYQSRLSAGLAALLAALLAAAAALLFGRRPGRTGLLILLSGIVGVVAISLFYINTFYVLAAPFWLASAMLSLADWAFNRAPSQT
jgi:drug/metabolite transporter (DMT)-like permease